MSGTTWTKFFWADWESDPALRLCSFAAQGLWMRLLCIAAAHDPIGYVAVAGRALDETSIARMTGGLESEVRVLLGELDRNGVFSRDRHARIYSRRMVSDAKRAAIARKNGLKGGNPSLGNNTPNPPPDNPPVKPPDKPQEPVAIYPEKNPAAETRAGDWSQRLAEANEAAGDMADLTVPTMHSARDLRPLVEPTAGEPCTWDEVLEAIRITAARQRARRKPIKSWSWIAEDAWTLRDKRLNAPAPDAATVVPFRAGQSITDKIAEEHAEAQRRAFARMDAEHG